MRRAIFGVVLLSLTLLTASFATAADGENYFRKTELQIHAEKGREPGDTDIFTITVDRFSEWKYGDNFFFLDILGKDNFKAAADSLYFEFAPRFSLDRILGAKVLPFDFLGETYATVQYNDSDKDYINRVFLGGFSVDFAGQPNYGWSNLSFLVRDEDTQDLSYQITFCWGQPFSIAGLDMEFKGFADYWEDDLLEILLAEPQLRLKMSSFVGKDHILSDAVIGTEIETSHNFGGNDGWEINPTLFFAFPL